MWNDVAGAKAQVEFLEVFIDDFWIDLKIEKER